MKSLKILIEPSFESTMKEMGISPDEDYNGEAILFQQGYNMFQIKIKPGEKFKIKKKTKGLIDCSKTQYKFIRKKEEWETEEDLWEEECENEDNLSLTPGKYKFLEDGVTIEELAKKD